MQSEDWFIVGLRLFGVWLLISSLAECVTGVESHFGMISLHASTQPAYWFHASVDALAGWFLLTTAPGFADLLCWEILPKKPCPKCGYDLRETPDRCPECGTSPEGFKAASETGKEE